MGSSGRRAESLGDVPDQFMECRAWRQHVYTKSHDSVYERDGRVVEISRWRQCGRCEFEYTVAYAISSRGQWSEMSRSSIYPASYLIKGGGIGLDDMRNEYLTRRGKVPNGSTRVVPIRKQDQEAG